jgi:aspartyl/asparaginyl-tRNA synthetase
MKIGWRQCFLAVLVCAAVALPIRAAEKIITPIDKIAETDQDKWFTVQGVIDSSRKFRSGMRYVVNDGAGKITLVLFDRELRQVPKREQLVEGATVNVTGKIDVFQKQIQIVPVRGTDVIIVQAAPPVTPAAIDTITSADKDKTKTVQGVVTEASNFSQGFKFALNDGSGQIDVVLFDNVYDGLALPGLVNAGATLRVTGKVDEFNDELEIVPGAPGRVEVIEPPKREVRKYSLGSITGNDHNALVQVEGEIASAEPFEYGTDILLKDTTGVQRIRLYKVVAERLAKLVPLTTGAKVNVIGRVRASRSKGLSIEVALPVDVTVAKA